MSDITLPPLRPSPNREASYTQPSTEHSILQDEISTLPTSQDSLDGQSLLEGDQKKEERRRKRTSPEDQAILEAEYKANPKPDKAARLEIVRKVSLGEKAVQIWFQNRRQNTRRKSRPLLPHEIAAFGLGGMAALSSDPSVHFRSSQGPGQPPSSSQSFEADTVRSYLPRANVSEAREHGVSSPVTAGPLSTPPADSQHDASAQGQVPNYSLSQPSSQQLPPPSAMAPGYFANRRSASSGHASTPMLERRTTFDTPNASAPVQPSSCPERLLSSSDNDAPSSSQVRLSMSLDGKASLVSAEVTISPLKPRNQNMDFLTAIPKRRVGLLQRSQSALPYSQNSLSRPNLSSLASRPGTPNLPTGRSRDARSWEFCCDTDARDELTTQADHESSGSAVAAISLLRSASNTALKVNINKRNSPAPNHTRTEETGKSIKRPKFGRAQSSLARLQGTEKSMRHEASGKPKEGTGLVKSPGGDSDKENWVPTVEGGHRRHNRTIDAARKASQKPQSRRKELDLENPRRTAKIAESTIFEDATATRSADEVERFMRGEVSPSKKGDLDCIQGLLSLSQGNWR